MKQEYTLTFTINTPPISKRKGDKIYNDILKLLIDSDIGPVSASGMRDR